jgi:hypothetical protein
MNIYEAPLFVFSPLSCNLASFKIFHSVRALLRLKLPSVTKIPEQDTRIEESSWQGLPQ